MPYTAVSRSIWASRKFRKLDAFQRLFYFYLLTNEHVNSLGTYRFHWANAIADMGLELSDAPKVQLGLERLQEIGIVEYDPEERLLRLVNFLTFNTPRNPKHATFLCTLAADLPPSFVREHAVSELLSYENVKKCSGLLKLNGNDIVHHIDTGSKSNRYHIDTGIDTARAHDTLHPHPGSNTQEELILKKNKEKKGGPVDKSEQVATALRQAQDAAAKPTRRAGVPRTAGEHLASALKKLRPRRGAAEPSNPTPRDGARGEVEARTHPLARGSA